MRLILAALFCLTVTALPVILLLQNNPKAPLPWWGGLLQSVWTLVVITLTWRLFRESHEEEIAGLEAHGLLTGTSYSARRAFQVAELEDEGPGYFIELQDGSVLFLSGQYLHDYGQDEEAQNPQFPCASFTIRRHQTKGHVVDILCSGPALKLDAEAPPLTLEEMSSDNALEDGQIIRNRTYDELRKERMKTA